MAEPFYVQWHITNLCNLRCQHCYQDDFSRNGDLDGAGLKKVSDHLLTTLREWNRTACIHLTGGEPLLKPEIFPLLDDLNRRSEVEDLGLITNGLCLSQAVLKRLSAFRKLTKLKISLDGATAELNDSIRQEGAFEKVMETLPFIREENRFQVILMFTVMKRNYRDLPTLIRLCQELGVDGLILERFIPLGKGRQILHDVLDKDQWNEWIDILVETFCLEAEKSSLVPYQAFQVSFVQGEMELSGAPCIIGADGLCILPSGDVLPCRRFPVVIGNLLEVPLTRLWETSEILETLRKKENLKGKCKKCGVSGCRGCRSLALSLTGDYLAEDPHCGIAPR
jgi:radical SAM protein with 4Fe4S-binding SPASM domain